MLTHNSRMREVTFEAIENKPKEVDLLANSVDNTWTQIVSPDFVPKDSYHVTKRNEQFVSISYNSRKKMFVLVDSNGVTTWEWQKYTNKINRVIKFPVKDSKLITDCVYCLKHNCYFTLAPNNSISVLNRDFDEIYSVKTSNTILCMIYNPLRDELLTSSLNGVKVWCMEPMIPNKSDSTKPLGHYQLNLKKELNFVKDWVKKIDIDSINCQLYCCTARDLFIYDFNGNLMRHYGEVHKMPITCCVYSPTAKVVITGSADCDIKIWSVSGGLLETFRAHSLPISSIILNPHNSNLILSSSLDGTIKMWSLDIMQMVYQLNLFKSEILWMGITEENLLYVASPFDVTLWSITNFIDFWSITRDKIRNIDFDYAKGRSCRMLIVTEENTIRLFNRDQVTQLTAVLPIPNLNNKLRMLSIVYSRYYDIMYILLNNNELWLYYTKTNPSTHLVVLDVNLVLENNDLMHEQSETNGNSESKKASNLIVNDVLKNHRAIEYDLDYLEKNERSKCRCICILESEVIYWRVQGPSRLATHTFLLLGLENGNVVFCDALTQTKKYLSLNCSKDPVVEVIHNKLENYLIVRVELSSLFHIQYYSLPALELTHEVFCPKSMTAYARLKSKVFLGFEDGSMDMVEVEPVETTVTFNRTPNDTEITNILEKHRKYEHKQKVDLIDVCQRLEMFLSCSYDGCIKLWSLSKELIIEIKLDETLSHCRFLDSSGDLICGYRNHIFKIVLKRILPEYTAKHEATKEDYYDEYNDTFVDDSVVIEDPGLLSNDDQVPLKIDLNKYLHPFDVRCDRNGLLRVHQPEKKKINTDLALSHRKNELEVKSVESIISTLPDSLFETPRENPLANLRMIDLTLGSKFSQLDLRAYLIDWLTDSLTNSKIPTKSLDPRDWKFPIFGYSPNSTPTYTPPPMEGEEECFDKTTADDDITNVVKYTADEQAKLQKAFQDKMTLKLDKEMLDEIEEKKPNDSYRAPESFKEKADSLNLGFRITKRSESSSAEKSLIPDTPTRFQLPSQTSVKPVAKAYSVLAPTELKPNLRDSKPVELLEDKTESSFRMTARPAPVKRSVKRESVSQKRNSPLQRSARSVSSCARRPSFTAAPTNSLIKEVSRKNSLKSTTASIISSDQGSMIQIKNTSTPMPTHRSDTKPPVFNSAKSSSTKPKRLEEPIIFQSDDINKLPQPIQQNSSRLSVNTMESDISISNYRRTSVHILDKENSNGMTREKEVAYNLLGRHERKPVSRTYSRLESQFDVAGADKTKFLFEYLYGMKGTPIRLSSGFYQIPYKNKRPCTVATTGESGPVELINELVGKERLGDEENTRINEDEKHLLQYASGNSVGNTVFGDWLNEYERKKIRSSHRRNRAKENNEYQTMEYQRTLLSTLYRKHSDSDRLCTLATQQMQNRETFSFTAPHSSPFSDGANSERALKAVLSTIVNKDNINNRRQIKSAFPHDSETGSVLTERNQLQKRAKSVSFMFDKPGNPIGNMKHIARTAELKPKVKTPKPIIRLQPAYLVSQIEMEEIFSEALKRLEDNRAKLADMDTSSIGKRPLSGVSEYTLKSRNFNMQESNYINSATESSDNELENSVFSKADSIQRKFRCGSTNGSANSRPRSRIQQATYQMPSKLDNWTTEHRLSMRSAGSNTAKSNGSNMSKIIDFSDSEEEEEEFTTNTENFLKFSRFQLERQRTANSIPSKNGKYVFIKAPELNLEYQLPNSPEKHLLPVRFPKLYSKIIKNINEYNKKLEAEEEQKKKEEFLGIEIF